MICGMEIGLAIFGIMSLVRGKMTLSKNKVVVGIPARLLGLLALTPLPIAFGVGVLYAIVKGVGANGAVADNDRMTLTLIEAGIVIGIAILVFVIGAIVAISPEEAERRERGNRYAEDDEYEDERDDRRSRRDERDDRDDNDPDRDERERKPKPWNR